MALDPASIVTVGRDIDCDLLADDPSVSRHHARIASRPDGAYEVEDLGSTNGTWVHGVRVSRAVLCDGDLVQLGATFGLRFAMARASDESLQRELFESSVRDALTGVHSRRYFDDRIDADIATGRDEGVLTALAIIDVDHFKTVNDRFGHLAGDKLLRDVAKAFGTVTRAGDLLARYGGDEFVLRVRVPDEAGAMELAGRVQRSVGATRFVVGRGVVWITVSMGLALSSELPAGEGSHRLIAIADARLYRAKRAGRNRVAGPT